MDINVTSPKVIRELLDKYKIAPLKRYGQNFLVDGNIAGKIAFAAAPEACMTVSGMSFGPENDPQTNTPSRVVERGENTSV